MLVGVGGYSYLYEPLWWIGMTTSESCSLALAFLNLLLSDIIFLVNFLSVSATSSVTW